MPGFNDLATADPDLAKQWNDEMNGGLSPHDVTGTSHAAVWWTGKCGHVWKATVANRRYGSGCPYCCGKKVLEGFNDAKSNYPEFIGEWDYEKNEFLPEQVSVFSQKEIWWKCSKGHSWKAKLPARRNGSGCPYCGNRRVAPGENDLASRHPELLKEWDYERNRGILPENITYQSRKKVWWICEQAHAWQATVKSRSEGSNCPICAHRQVVPGKNDLTITHPLLAAQWHPTKNEGLRPEDVVAGTARRVWWQCGKGHAWRSAVSARASSGSGCPVCAGKTVLAGENDLATLFPHIAAQWNSVKNSTLTPMAVTPFSNRKVWWTCELGHTYEAQISSRTSSNTGCPYCAGRKVLPGFNDLSTKDPVLSAQWHPTLNGNLTPEMVTVGSHKKVWWQCGNDHVWKAVVRSRATGRKCGCPVCAGKVSERETTHRRIVSPALHFEERNTWN